MKDKIIDKVKKVKSKVFNKKTEVRTPSKITWCPGCFNNQILAGVEKYLKKQIESSENAAKKKDEFALVTGIGCHGKMFDYLNLNGLNTLHGRVLPTMLGIKIGNPNLNVIGFAGDGDAYAEGVSHLVHAARYNADLNYFVHNNQVFALTVGQPTPTTEIGFKDKTNPFGVKVPPLNPMKFMLANGATFVARVFADSKQISWVMKEAIKHKGFSFIEVLQPCIVFHPHKGYKEQTYMLQGKKNKKSKGKSEKHDKTSFKQAWKKAEEFDYNPVTKKTKIPLGIFYQVSKETFEEQIPAVLALKKQGKSWKDIER
ncbi:2-oxoacid:ferredoxin oxidoreductase subunit beta [Candidatus Pacearchaeota archaeon]|nr:2-oxoacid:ferredoxin oxidoreductase subunit beta [Candidatus Pacearchaeota archaeon]